MPANNSNKEAATAFINRQDALGVSNFEVGLGRAMQQDFPAGRINHVIFLTDGLPNLGETELEALSDLVGQWSGGQARLFTIGVGNDVDQGFLAGLAEAHRGEAYFLSEEGGIETALLDLFEVLTFPVLLLDELSFDHVEIHEVHPRGVESLAAGRELFQVGRYREGGRFTLSLTGRVGEERISIDFPLEFTRSDVSADLIPRVWAYQKVQALEEQIARFGAQQELLDDILALGLDYRLVTRRTSLFAPDETVEINPEPRDDDRDRSVTGVDEAESTATWLGRDFVLQDEVWVDVSYRPGMPRELYQGRADQPSELAAYAELGQNMLVVMQSLAYEIRAGEEASRPAAAAERPQPLQCRHHHRLSGAGGSGRRANPPGHLQPGRTACAPAAAREPAGGRAPAHLGRTRRPGTGGGQRSLRIPPGGWRTVRPPAHAAAALRVGCKARCPHRTKTWRLWVQFFEGQWVT